MLNNIINFATLSLDRVIIDVEKRETVVVTSLRFLFSPRPFSSRSRPRFFCFRSRVACSAKFFLICSAKFFLICSAKFFLTRLISISRFTCSNFEKFRFVNLIVFFLFELLFSSCFLILEIFSLFLRYWIRRYSTNRSISRFLKARKRKIKRRDYFVHKSNYLFSKTN